MSYDVHISCKEADSTGLKVTVLDGGLPVKTVAVKTAAEINAILKEHFGDKIK